MAEAGRDLWAGPTPAPYQAEQVAEDHVQATFEDPFRNAGIWGKASENRVSQMQARVFWHGVGHGQV